MIIIGGVRTNGLYPEGSDDWPFGLGVFDLSEMMFKDRYDADASAYTSPDVVKRWYAKNGFMAKDISQDVKDLFSRSSATDPSINSADTSTEVRSSSSSSNSNAVNTAVIAGGVVEGFIFLVAVVWTCICRRCRRRNRISNTSQPSTPQPSTPQPSTSQPSRPQPSTSQPIESNSRVRCEIDSRARSEEMGGLQQIYETEAPPRYELH